MSEQEHPDVLRSAARLIAAATRAGVYDPETGTWTGGGGGAPVNWAEVTVEGHGDPLTHSANSYGIAEADLTIREQSGDDFSVGTGDGGHGAILSAGGGRFMFALASGGGSPVTLDPGDTSLRAVWVSAIGKTGGPGSSGIDYTYPIIKPQTAQTLLPGAITYADPGDPVIQAMEARGLNLAEGDSIPLDGVLYNVTIWQV